jgi:hypothetical protein
MFLHQSFRKIILNERIVEIMHPQRQRIPLGDNPFSKMFPSIGKDFKENQVYPK